MYRKGDDLLGRDMLMEGRFYGLRFYFGVRITGVFDEKRDTSHGPERVWGWCYETLQGHLEQGRISFEVIKNRATGQVGFRVTGYSRRSHIRSPLVRWASGVFGRWTQQRYYRAVQRRLYELVQAAQRGEPLPTPAEGLNGLMLAPPASGASPAERLAPRWVHPGPDQPPGGRGADDRLFPASFQQQVALDRLRIRADILPGGHLIALAQPGPLADCLLHV